MHDESFCCRLMGVDTSVSQHNYQVLNPCCMYCEAMVGGNVQTKITTQSLFIKYSISERKFYSRRTKYRLKTRSNIYRLGWWFGQVSLLCLFSVSDRGDRLCSLTANMRTIWRTAPVKEGSKRSTYNQPILRPDAPSRELNFSSSNFFSCPFKIGFLSSLSSQVQTWAGFWNVWRIRN